MLQRVCHKSNESGAGCIQESLLNFSTDCVEKCFARFFPSHSTSPAAAPTTAQHEIDGHPRRMTCQQKHNKALWAVRIAALCLGSNCWRTGCGSSRHSPPVPSSKVLDLPIYVLQAVMVRHGSGCKSTTWSYDVIYGLVSSGIISMSARRVFAQNCLDSSLLDPAINWATGTNPCVVQQKLLTQGAPITSWIMHICWLVQVFVLWRPNYKRVMETSSSILKKQAGTLLRRPPWKRLSFETQSWLQKWPPPNASAKRPNTLSESELAVHVSAAGSLNCAMETAAKDLLRNSPVAWPHFHSSVLTL